MAEMQIQMLLNWLYQQHFGDQKSGWKGDQQAWGMNCSMCHVCLWALTHQWIHKHRGLLERFCSCSNLIDRCVRTIRWDLCGLSSLNPVKTWKWLVVFSCAHIDNQLQLPTIFPHLSVGLLIHLQALYLQSVAMFKMHHLWSVLTHSDNITCCLHAHWYSLINWELFILLAKFTTTKWRCALTYSL